MTDTAVIDPAEDALYERIRILLFSADLPAQRLESDIDDIGRFTAPDVRSSQLRLIEVMPPLTPAAEAIVRAMIRAYGTELFGRGSANSALRAMIKAGPVRFGQTALTLGPDAPLPERVRPLVAEINRIFERYPESGFSHARYFLSAIGLPVGRDRLPQVHRSVQRGRKLEGSPDSRVALNNPELRVFRSSI
ncbi:hypothetical protein [Paraburkholderia atlantica]|uniref:hypothetical protein n=1 Tax=Paraburkholderia atlantica TaxID=2654982 RepID=UPI00161AB3A9|nr:hypothetical protein [Paraburkholderia atlantica]MBB5509105.1 hypothetical protein [Paraburkholderia atlantica]